MISRWFQNDTLRLFYGHSCTWKFEWQKVIVQCMVMYGHFRCNEHEPVDGMDI